MNFKCITQDYMLNGYNISVETNCNPNFKNNVMLMRWKMKLKMNLVKILIKTLEQAKRKYRKIKKKHQTKI